MSNNSFTKVFQKEIPYILVLCVTGYDHESWHDLSDDQHGNRVSKSKTFYCIILFSNLLTSFTHRLKPETDRTARRCGDLNGKVQMVTVGQTGPRSYSGFTKLFTVSSLRRVYKDKRKYEEASQ